MKRAFESGIETAHRDAIAQYIEHLAGALQEITGESDRKTRELSNNLKAMLEGSRS